MAKNSFESNLEALKKIVNDMDGKDIDIEKALAKFETGIKHYKNCYKFIEDAEKKVKVLIDGVEKDFKDSGDENGV